MPEHTGFTEFKIGQKVKMKGKRHESGAFLAQSITLDDSAHRAVIEDFIQGVAHERKVVRILDREIALSGNIKIKDLLRNVIDVRGLKKGDRVKLIGDYLESRQFVAEKVKIKEQTSFDLAELQGAIDRIDPENKRMEVLGFTIVVDEKTRFYGC